MRLVGQIHVTVNSNAVKRDPTLWEKLRRGMGGKVDLDTGRMENQLEATAIVDTVRRALGKLQVGNALSLVIDDTVVFHDSDGKPDDLPDLVLALSEHAGLFGRGFRELRFAAEHEETGLHLVIETRARTQHARNEPAAVVSVGGRLRALEPISGETAEAYRARVEPMTKDSGSFESGRLAFESFVARLQGALQAAMPDATVETKKAESRLVKAPENAVAAREHTPHEPMHRGYDPFAMYYPSPMGLMLDVMIFSSLMHMMMPPTMMLVSPMGAPIATASEVQANPELASDASLAAHDSSGTDDSGDSAGGQGEDSHGGDGEQMSGGDEGGGDSGGWFDSAGGDTGGWDDGGGDFGGGLD